MTKLSRSGSAVKKSGSDDEVYAKVHSLKFSLRDDTKVG